MRIIIPVDLLILPTMPKLSLERCLLCFCAIWGASIFWIAHHPPGVDFAQHAGQISLLVDLYRGDSPWADQLRVNLATPYLLGYGLAFPLALVMPVSSALKVLLTVAYLGFVYAGVRMRQHFGADKRLDWIFLLGMFGHPAYWGFFTFVLSTPLVFVFITVADKYAKGPSIRNSIWVLIIGLLLVISHGLAFAFAWCIGGALILAYQRKVGNIIRATIPYALLLIPFLMFMVASRRMKIEMFGTAASGPSVFEFGGERLVRTLMYTVGGTAEIWVAAFGLLMLALPWAMGLRIDLRQPGRLVPFAVSAAIVLLAPETALDTGGIYSRFTIFLLPTYILMFAPSGHARPAWLSRLPSAALPAVMIGACVAMLGIHTWRERGFDREEADFRQVMESMEPGQRALSMVFDRYSEATRHRSTYLHHPLWYQAEKHGFVDFNFAWFPPQLVRYRPGIVPPVRVGFEWYPDHFEWTKHQAQRYRYFIVRKGPSMPAEIFKGAPCEPVKVTSAGSWSVYENQGCR